MKNKFAIKFDIMANKLQSQIDNKFADRQENTPKRQCQAGFARNEGYRLKRTQEAMRALAKAYEANERPIVLRDIKTKKDVYELMAAQMEGGTSGYYSVPLDTGKPKMDTPEALAIWAMIQGQTEEEKKAEELHRKIKSLQFANIPGYFPTPEPIIDMMIERADIESHHIVLEPSAGSGTIMDAVKPLCKNVLGVEVHYTLFKILEGKNHSVVYANFMNWCYTIEIKFDRILMNPPFEKLQDIDHVIMAYDLMLKPGGILVSIMSPAPFFRSDKKSTAFRTWFDDIGGEVEILPANSFKESGTGVNSQLVVLCKPL